MPEFYRFRVSIGFLSHLWKSATRQDHRALGASLARHLPRAGVAIDVGAHGGQITRLLAGIAADGLVVAVEPSGYTRAILRLALLARGCRNVVVVAAALGASCGATLLRTPIKRGGDMGYGLANLVDAGAHAIAEPVAVLTLDSLVEQLGLARVDVIKADIEGYEAQMIAGAQAVLARFRPAVLMEMDDRFLRRAGGSLAGLWQQMLALGFRPHRADGTPLAAAVPEAPQGDILWLPAERCAPAA